MKYFLYARKSEEDAKRQIASIPRQLKQLTERFPDCNILETFTEEVTAAKPGRPEFNKMIARIEQGEAEGILVWALNRLLRNEVDYGRVAWLVRSKQLKSVLTMEKEYTSKDNVLIMAVDAGISTQFIKDVEEHTNAAVSEKIKQGWFPHRAPEGYLNDVTKPQGQRDILNDPVRFPLIRKAWDMMLTGSYSVPEILKFLNNSGYRVRPFVKSSTGQLSKSALYRTFSNPFYMGLFRHDGKCYPGQHTAMVTEAEFIRVQQILGKDTRVRVGRHIFAYGGQFLCGKCNCQICGEQRYRKLKSGGVSPHTYYACTNAKRICDKKVVTEAIIDAQIEEKLRNISINIELRPVLLGIWREYYEEHIKTDGRMEVSRKAEIERKRSERIRLLDLRLQELIDDDLFRQKKAVIDAQIAKMEDLLERGVMIQDKVEDTERVLLFMTEPKERYSGLPSEDKRTTVSHLGSHYSLTDGKLAMELNKLLIPAQNNARRFEVEYATLSRSVFRSESNKKAAHDRFCLAWGRIWDSIRTQAVEDDLTFPSLPLT